jgi:small subunit ribosomal protein S6
VKAIRDTKVKRSAQPIAPAQHAPAAEATTAVETDEEKKPAAAAPAEHAPAETVASAV